MLRAGIEPNPGPCVDLSTNTVPCKQNNDGQERRTRSGEMRLGESRRKAAVSVISHGYCHRYSAVALYPLPQVTDLVNQSARVTKTHHSFGRHFFLTEQNLLFRHSLAFFFFFFSLNFAYRWDQTDRPQMREKNGPQTRAPPHICRTVRQSAEQCRPCRHVHYLERQSPSSPRASHLSNLP